MKLVLACLTGFLFATGMFMILKRAIVKIVIGFILVSHAINLAIFISAPISISNAPLLKNRQFKETSVSDPLPQALILTAIVISFGFLAFLIVLIKRIHDTTGSEDINDYRRNESIDKHDFK